MKILPCIVLVTLWVMEAAQSAEITVYRGLYGDTIVHIDGRIQNGDEQTFAARTNGLRGSVVVRLTSPGGYIVPAIAIGTMIHDRGYSTLVDTRGECASACPLIWFAGRRAMIKRDSDLVFHMPSDRNTGRADPEVNEFVIDYLHTIGLTDYQAQRGRTTRCLVRDRSGGRSARLPRASRVLAVHSAMVPIEILPWNMMCRGRPRRPAEAVNFSAGL